MKNNEKALAAFIEKIGNISEQLTELQEYVDNHMETDPEDINWGDVGSAEKVVSDLNNIMIFLGLKEEAK